MNMLKKLVRGGAVAAASKKMAPALGGAAAASKRMQPVIGAAVAAAKAAQPKSDATIKNQSDFARAAALKTRQPTRQPMAQAARMPGQAPLGGLRSAVKTAATNVKTAIEKQPALQKPAIGAALQKKPVGRVVGGLANKFLKRR